MSQKPAQRHGLGRGLGSLIPTQPAPDPVAAQPRQGAPAGVTAEPLGAVRVEPGQHRTGGPAFVGPSADESQIGAYFTELPIAQITPNERQPRQVFDEQAMGELVRSVVEVGVLQPVVVRRTGQDAYELIMGERRLRAAQQAGLHSIPTIVRETGDDAMLRDALLENLHRADLNPLEEAAAYEQLLQDFGCTHDELGERIGRSRPQITNTVRLLKLAPAVQRRVAAGVLSAGHARALLGVPDAESQERLAGRVVAEGISVRGLEELLALDGADFGRPQRGRASRTSAPGLDELGGRLSDRLDTRVRVTLGKAKGRIGIEFATLSDLERIVAIIDPRNRVDRPI
ncbi:MAG: ParB/RepB/Spo0J family partition protein [Actinomycetota bacterium]|nr:ParB/RepB/Spo0J family partition protein [Actinomycetota bacterium]